MIKTMTTEADFENALRESDGKPVFVFKHSTRCPISAGALQQVRNFEASSVENAPAIYMALVVENRALSNAIAERLGVKHESPQAILVSGGRAIWSRTHRAISAAALSEAATEAV